MFDRNAWEAKFRERNRVKLRKKRMSYYYRTKLAKRIRNDPLTFLTCARFS